MQRKGAERRVQDRRTGGRGVAPAVYAMPPPTRRAMPAGCGPMRVRISPTQKTAAQPITRYEVTCGSTRARAIRCGQRISALHSLTSSTNRQTKCSSLSV
eukprot:6200867-Pleurochrysis_carterae.AAC.3